MDAKDFSEAALVGIVVVAVATILGLTSARHLLTSKTSKGRSNVARSNEWVYEYDSEGRLVSTRPGD